MRYSLMALVLLFPLAAQKLPNLYHDEAYGDAPFRYEEGWRPLLNGKDLSGWHSIDGSASEWFTTRAVLWKRIWNPVRLVAKPEPGDRIVNGKEGRTANLVTDEKFGSFQLYAEFITAKGSNSGIYLHGLYEVQIFDSYGYSGPLKVGDCGGIYEREDGGGSPPAVNASRPPGEWQSLRIWFEAPRFDASGKKVADARVWRVMLNGTPVQEKVDLPGPTVSHMNIPEAATNPLMLQGDHGPVAYRNIWIRKFDPPDGTTRE
ncbi:MAG TPA: DUF1080 domain-containing protein [Bryobacteraceae bacterium]|jgi:hypothetical protein|nr:DUF1080 domain-containing protein [Bryobacteraceae bacterium]